MSIPILYDKNTTNFNTEGLGRLTDTVEDVIVTENTSGFFELEMVYLLDAELSPYITEGNFIYSHTSERDSDMLKFTIYSVEPDYTEGLLYVNARLTLLDVFMKSVVPEGIYNTTDTRNVLNNLKTHIYPTYNFTVTGADNLKFYLEHEETTVYDIIYGTNGLVEQTGVTLRFYDNGIQVTSTRGNQQPVEITERDFLEQFKIKESRENMVTRIIPYTTLMKDVTIKEDDRWTKDTNETKVYGTPVLSQNIANGYPVVTRYIEYRNEITGTRGVVIGDDTIELNTYKYEEIGTLNTEALSFFTENPNIDEYEITTTIESLGLYENQYGRLESLALYDRADIYIAKHQKLVRTSVTEVVHNVTVGRNTALRFETAKATIGKVESVLNSGKVSQKELSNIVASQNQNIRITNSIINAHGNRVNFTTVLPPASMSKEGDVTFLEKDDRVELWEFRDGVWVIDMVVSNDQYIKDKVGEAMAEAEQAKEDAIKAYEDAVDEAKRSADEADALIRTEIEAEVGTIGEEMEQAKQEAVNASNKALTDAKAHAVAQDVLLKQAIGLEIDEAIEIAEQAKRDASTKAQTAYDDAVAEADRLAGLRDDGITIEAGQITAGVIDAARLDAKLIVTSGLTANVIKSTHIQADELLVDKVFANQASVDKLWAKTIWANKITAMEINASQIKTGTISTARLDATDIVTSGLTTDIVKSTHIQTSTLLVDKIFANQAMVDRLWSKAIWTTKLTAMKIDASQINAGTIDTARLNTSEIVTKGLTADVVTSTHIKANNALIDTIFGTTALIEKLTSKTAFINSIKAIDISASRITTGTLNASNVTITNLDVNTLTGNKSNFITSLFNGTNSSVRITSVGMDALRTDGSIAARFINDGVQIWGAGTWVGSLSYATGGMVLWVKNNRKLDIGYQGANTSPSIYSTALSIDGNTGDITADRPLNLGSSLDVTSTTTLAGNIYLNGNVLSKINAKSDLDVTGNARFRGDIHVTNAGDGIRFRNLTLSGDRGVAILNVTETSGIWFGNEGKYAIKSDGGWRIQTPGY